MAVVEILSYESGDVQPFVALAKRLQKDGHHMRMATHGNFGTFVSEHGIEFFDIGGDPEDLMSYMVKSEGSSFDSRNQAHSFTDPGLVPGLASIKNGDIGRKRTMLKEVRCATERI